MLGLNGRVAALLRKNGRLLWATDLPGVMGDRFVTVTSDATHIYACTRGQVHCLDIESGGVLWSNDLKGFGYGVATLCLPGTASDATPAAHTKLAAERRE